MTSSHSPAVDTLYPFGDTATITVTGPVCNPQKPNCQYATQIKIRIPGWADKATLAIGGKAATLAKNGTVVAVPLSGTGKTTIVLELNPEIKVEKGWGVHAGTPSPSAKFSAQGATITPTDAYANFTYVNDVAAAAVSKLPNTMDIRSGEPGETTKVIVKSEIVGEGHYLDTVTVAFRYVYGYGPAGVANPDGVTMSLVVVDAASKSEDKIIYTSPVLNKYSWDQFKGYSPTINATAKNLKIPNGKVLQVGPCARVRGVCSKNEVPRCAALHRISTVV